MLSLPIICERTRIIDWGCCRFSLLNRGAEEELLPLCQAEGIAVAPYQVYEGGLLTGKYKAGAPPPPGSRATGDTAKATASASASLHPFFFFWLLVHSDAGCCAW